MFTPISAAGTKGAQQSCEPQQDQRIAVVGLFKEALLSVTLHILCCFWPKQLRPVLSEPRGVNPVHQFVRLVVLFGTVLIILVESHRFWYRFLTRQTSAAKSLWLSGCLMTVGAMKLM